MYGVNRSMTDYHTGNARLQADLQTYLAGLGNVPWAIGGDWNFEPLDLPSFWQRPHAVVAPLGTYPEIRPHPRLVFDRLNGAQHLSQHTYHARY